MEDQRRQSKLCHPNFAGMCRGSIVSRCCYHGLFGHRAKCAIVANRKTKSELPETLSATLGDRTDAGNIWY
eukprot:2316190-Amphidinium_carterae.1